MQVKKCRVKGYFLAGFHPASILRPTTPFSIYSVPICILCSFGLLQRFCRYFGWRPTYVKKIIPAKSGQDRPRPTKNLNITWTGLVPLYIVYWPCLVTSFPHMPSGQGQREGQIIQGASALYLVQIITIPASAVDHHGPLHTRNILTLRTGK